MKLITTVLMSFGLLLVVEQSVSADLPVGKDAESTVVVISTNMGNITAELSPNTPVTTKNFLHYVNDGFYNNTIFHRVIAGFMIQGGGFSADMKEKVATAAAIHNEGASCLKNGRGVLAMARTNDPHSATAQFFINTVDNQFLDFTAETEQGFGYCGFGRVTSGMDVVEKIDAVATTNYGPYQDVPVTPVIIKSVTLESK